MHLEPDRLTLLALGDEPVDAEVADHLASCASCREEYESLREIVDHGRRTDAARDLLAPPPRVWDEIMRQILAESQLLSESQAAAIAGPGGLTSRRDVAHGRDMTPASRTASDDAIGGPRNTDTSNGHRPARPLTSGRTADPAPPRTDISTPRLDSSAPWTGPAPGRGRRVGQAAALAAAVAVIAVAGVLGLMALRGGDGTTPLSRTQLAALPEAPPSAYGSAELVRVGTATELRLTLSGMPLPVGYYEAWLFDPGTGAMYPMGPITATGGTITVTGVDLGRFTGVDISAQPMDGSGGHGESMLRGALK
jgi:hypothetical protein